VAEITDEYRVAQDVENVPGLPFSSVPE